MERKKTIKHPTFAVNVESDRGEEEMTNSNQPKQLRMKQDARYAPGCFFGPLPLHQLSDSYFGRAE